MTLFLLSTAIGFLLVKLFLASRDLRRARADASALAAERKELQLRLRNMSAQVTHFKALADAREVKIKPTAPAAPALKLEAALPIIEAERGFQPTQVAFAQTQVME